MSKSRVRADCPVHGVIVVDKEAGPTSHDVVALMRRALGSRTVGHAGTLDPAATGVLVVLCGEGTKLGAYLMARDKEYEATVALGAETDSLDADGTVVATADVPDGIDAERVDQALQGLVGTRLQTPPAVSAIKKDGRPMHARVRSGEEVSPEPRQVVLHEAVVQGVEGSEVRLRVRCGKGFYVRSLARDLARALGTLGHLQRLRRTRSGRFGVDSAAPMDLLRTAAAGEAGAQALLCGRALGVLDAWRPAATADLTEAGAEDVRHGRAIGSAGLVSGSLPALAADETVGLVAGCTLVALARVDAECLRVVRGFRYGHALGEACA